MRTVTASLPLVPLAVGDVVDRAAWAPHVTVLGNARVPDGATDTVADLLRGIAAATPPLPLRVGGGARFGPDGSVPVDLVDSPALVAMHRRLVDALERAVPGFVPIEPAHLREGYRPHRTVVPGPRPRPGDVLDAEEVVLVELDPPGRAGSALVLARWPLGGEAAGAETEAADVLAVVEALRGAAVPAWVIGGWGVDALVGTRTRAHHDVDLFVEADRTEGAIAALADLGYVVRFVWSENRWTESDGRLVPSAFVAVDAAGREVDVHTVRYRGGLVESRSVSTVELPPGALDVVGRIGGEAVPCASALAQLVMHSGYEVPERQRGDLAALRRLIA